MKICYRTPNLGGGAGSWGAYGVRINAKLCPFLWKGDSDGSVNFGSIITKPTTWVMHDSRQNDCNHVSVRGKCYSLDLHREDRPQYPDLPMWWVQYTDRWGSHWKEVNYPFPYRSCLDFLLTKYNPDVGVIVDLVAINYYCQVNDQYAGIYCRLDVLMTDLATGHKYFNTDPAVYESYGSINLFAIGDETTEYTCGRAWGTFRMDAYKGTCSFELDPNNINIQPKPRYSFDDNSVECTMLLPSIQDELHFDASRAFGLDFDYETALARGLDQVNFFGSNGLAFIHDVKSLPTTIARDLDSLKSLTKVTGSGKIKIAAQAFLSVHYGYKLLAADGIELAESLASYCREHTLHIGQSFDATNKLTTVGNRTLESASGHLNVYYDPYAQIESELMAFAEAVDVVPDISNVWDMIPFSFVVDWFTNIGELAQGIDDFYTLTQQHKVLGSIMSQTVSYRSQPSGYLGMLHCRYYNRHCSEGWYPIPRFSFQLKNPVTDLYHWLEASALVVSTKM